MTSSNCSNCSNSCTTSRHGSGFVCIIVLYILLAIILSSVIC